MNSEEGNDFIKKNIISGVPFIATKMGAVEQNVLISNGNYNDKIRIMASNNAGITPADNSTLDFFVNNYVKALVNSDIIGIMGIYEKEIVKKYSLGAMFSELRFLEPFYFCNPWSELLSGKNILVIHPFEETIINQYRKKDFIFKNKKVLVDFNLKTIKSEQTNGGGTKDSKPFVDSLDIMKSKIDKIDFDIALIGCGAYGLLLSDYIKEKKKQAIHIGGGLQILFGIKGKRWDVHDDVKLLYNENWCRPRDDEKTINYNVVEGGTYW
jgi:hypothetical protein